jgi:hypothetical protein
LLRIKRFPKKKKKIRSRGDAAAQGERVGGASVVEGLVEGTYRLYLKKKPALIIQANLSITFIDKSSELLII